MYMPYFLFAHKFLTNSNLSTSTCFKPIILHAYAYSKAIPPYDHTLTVIENSSNFFETNLYVDIRKGQVV